MNYLRMFGDELEYKANKILKKEFNSVEWVSKKNRMSPFDFLCADTEGNELKIDVKSCLNNIIHVSKNKFNKIKKDKDKNFYFMLYNGEGFHLIYFGDIKKYGYTFVFDNFRYYNLDKREKIPIILRCNHCKYEWLYKGNKTLATCPRCLFKVYVRLKLRGKDEKS